MLTEHRRIIARRPSIVLTFNHVACVCVISLRQSVVLVSCRELPSVADQWLWLPSGSGRQTHFCAIHGPKSVTNFTHVHKTPMHALSWECFAIKQSSFWYPDVLLFTVTGKLLFKNCLELGAPTLGASGLFPPCRPHCYATVADPQMGDEGDTSPTGIQQFCPWKIPPVTHCVCQIVTTRAILWLTINKKRLTIGICPSPSAPSWI